MTGRLAGKTAVVVGAGQQPGETMGNGRAIALTLAREGAELLCVDRDHARAEATVAEITDAGGTAFAFAADIVTEADAIVSAALERWGRIDICVDNVGIGHRADGPAHAHDDDAFETVFAVNFTGARKLVKAVLGPMREAGSGSIVLVSSLASVAGANMVAYEISKAALNRLAIATALGSAKRGVRCNAVLPGLIDTPMGVGGTAARDGRDLAAQRAARDAMVPLKGGMGSAWDVANAVLFLASDEARFVTGVLLPVDGGQGARIG
ncbi:SDR family NAD(P)-dependent oxidoreductase [Altererythrobacter sp. TH136]|uniref:SDR family NAD(P)-dependent oxidoreductase n=1 Tax=Altererythrobacter sp. TH136 TaxID=2067415 RepID=UPI0011652EF3|nr:SDR family NAD(P)-dependent oxidoreductase [Altererythrobacter sp. TH136]QDM40949.1 SDR family oxidoreductase [Altererythrobacter sp. TH136]